MTQPTGTTGASDDRINLRGKLTPEEVVDSLDWFDEIAIEQATGRSIEQMVKTDHEILMLRAIGSVVIARSDGIKIEQAFHQTVKRMRQDKVKALFAPDDEEAGDVLEDDPDSDVGKDDSPPAGKPTSWPISASQPA